MCLSGKHDEATLEGRPIPIDHHDAVMAFLMTSAAIAYLDQLPLEESLAATRAAGERSRTRRRPARARTAEPAPAAAAEPEPEPAPVAAASPARRRRRRRPSKPAGAVSEGAAE
jgi:hypothetical protein